MTQLHSDKRANALHQLYMNIYLYLTFSDKTLEVLPSLHDKLLVEVFTGIVLFPTRQSGTVNNMSPSN